MWERTWIGVTGQRWKAHILVGLLCLLIATFVAAAILVNLSREELGMAVLFTGVLLGVPFVLWTFFAMSCPFCKARVIWSILRTLPHKESVYVAFFGVRHCPNCKRSFFEKNRDGRGR